jgi:hypothetical protein
VGVAVVVVSWGTRLMSSETCALPLMRICTPSSNPLMTSLPEATFSFRRSWRRTDLKGLVGSLFDVPPPAEVVEEVRVRVLVVRQVSPRERHYVILRVVASPLQVVVRILQVFGRFLPENGRLRLEDDGREVFHNLAENLKFPQGLRPTRAKHEFYMSPLQCGEQCGEHARRGVTW